MKPKAFADDELSELRKILSSPAFEKARAWVEYHARPRLAIRIAEGYTIQEAIVTQGAKDAGIYEAFESLEDLTKVPTQRTDDPTRSEGAWEWLADPKDVARLAELKAKAERESQQDNS